LVQNGRLGNRDAAVLRCSPDGTVISSLGYGQSSAFGGLSNPAGVAIDTAGNAVVTVPDYGWVCQSPRPARFGPSSGSTAAARSGFRWGSRWTRRAKSSSPIPGTVELSTLE
jgi:hypothetical protein